MKRFTFAKLAKMGEMDEKYGQTYWGETNEQLEPVKFNSMNENITDEDTIEAEEILLKESKKTGDPYHQLKKVKVVVAPGQVVSFKGEVGGEDYNNKVNSIKTAPPQPTQLDRIEEKIDKLLGAQQDAETMPADFLIPEEENE